MKTFKPGRWIRVQDGPTVYPPMAEAMRRRQPPYGFEVESFSTRPYHNTNIQFGEVRVRYPDGGFSGAIYSDIFELIPLWFWERAWRRVRRTLKQLVS
jgi:hypothetical protein